MELGYVWSVKIIMYGLKQYMYTAYINIKATYVFFTIWHPNRDLNALPSMSMYAALCIRGMSFV